MLFQYSHVQIKSLKLTMQVNRVRNLGGTRSFLDYPVCPLLLLLIPVNLIRNVFCTYHAFFRQFNQVVNERVASVPVLDVLQRRLLPIDVNGRHVDAPKDNVLLISSHVGFQDINT